MLFREAGSKTCRFWDKVEQDRRDKVLGDVQAALAQKAEAEKNLAELNETLEKQKKESLVMSIVSGFLGPSAVRGGAD